MAIITKAGTPSKGSPTQFTLDKAELAAVTSVAADAYFSDTTNWKEVSLVYKSSTGSQKKILKFDASLSSPTANFNASAKALDIFQIHKIVIKDFDSDTFEVPRSQLTTAEFDVDMSGGSSPFIWDNLTYGSNLTTGLNGSLTRSGAESWTNAEALSTTSLSSGDFSITYNITLGFQRSMIVGIKNSTSLLGVPYGAYTDADYGIHIDGSTTFIVVANNPYAVNLGIPRLTDGTHEIKLEKIGTDLKFYVDSVLKYTVSSYTQTNNYPIYGAFYNTDTLNSVS